MIGAILKTNKKKEAELRRQNYQRQFEQSTVFFNGVRVNDVLVGRVRAAKADEVTIDDIKKVKIQSTIQRPINFPSFFDWFNHIRTEAKALINKNRQQIEINFSDKVV